VPPSAQASSLGELVPATVRELLRGHVLTLSRPVLGRRRGLHASLRAGTGREFRDHRPYVPGDDPRLLDWRAIARRDRLVLRQSESEDELDLVLVFDGSAAMSYGTDSECKVVVARAIAGALATLASRQGDRVGLVIGFAGRIDDRLLRPVNGGARLEAIARHLLALEPTGQCPWDELFTRLAPRLPARSLVVVFSDLLDLASSSEQADAVDEARLASLAQLRAHGHDIVLTRVLHRHELEFPWTSHRLLRFEDPRGVRAAIECVAAQVRDAYLVAFERHTRWLEETCESTALHLHRVITDEPLAAVLVGLLERIAGGAVIETRP